MYLGKKKMYLHYEFNRTVDLCFKKYRNMLGMVGRLGSTKFRMPGVFFRSKKFLNDQYFSFLFVSYKKFIGILRLIILSYRNVSSMHFIRVRIKGLGFKVRFISLFSIIKIFFAYDTAYYLFIPRSILVRKRSKKLILFSNNLNLLTIVFRELHCLKELGIYKLKGILRPKALFFLKSKVDRSR